MAMKKKFVIGCLVAVAAVLAVGGGAAYYYVVRPLTNTVKAGAELTRLVELEKRVKNQRPFTPPADGILEDAHVGKRHLR